MNKGIIGGLVFVVGFLSGSGATYLALKKVFEERSNDEIESVEEAFNKRIKEVEEERDNAVQVAKGKVIEFGEELKEKKDDVKSEILENKTALRNIISSIKSKRVNYSEQYQSNSPEAVAIDGVPSDDEPEEEDLKEVVDTVNNKRRNNRQIKIISVDDYGSIPGYDYKELYYYKGDGIVVDDSEDIIDNPELLIGNALTKYGFATNDEERIYVRNDDFACDYEIVKLFQRYAD